MVFTLPKLEYAYDALEPFIDAKTMEIHHSKHHQTYVDNLNKTLETSSLKDKPVEEILKDLNKVPEDIRAAVRNNGGGVFNHNLFWQVMTDNVKNRDFKGKIAEAIAKQFGSLDKFKEAMSDAGMKRFGSGWAWLVLNKGKLEIYSTANQDCPISEGKVPLLLLDVWEHSYYLKFQNKRKDYIASWWNVVDWNRVNTFYEIALKK